jgi:hypothetical protein
LVVPIYRYFYGYIIVSNCGIICPELEVLNFA